MGVCERCGIENPPAARFCNGCGAQLSAVGPAAVRKTVTIVFCDLVGSTALGERSDPEVLREILARYHETLRAILERHGGAVEKFVGDAAMAVFGIPQVREDDALRAVRAALEMRDAVVPLGLQVRVGVNTGEIVSGSGETLVTGDAVNVAARLEQAAGAQNVLIGPDTERLVRHAVHSEAVEPLTLKGKSEPMPAFRLLDLLPDAPAFTRAIGAPFVGRAAELAQLERALATACETRTPQLATIAGVPGIGKSRLARELLARADARVLVGRCLSYGEGITYWPLVEIVEQVGDLGAALGDGEEAALASARVGAAVGDADGSATPQEIAWGFRKLFEALARERPLIVVLDDIHWAEPALLDLVEQVASRAHDAPLLLLCTARPELFETRPAWAAANATVLALEPLAGGEVDALVARLGELPPDARAKVVEAAEGNPLFVEQLVAMRAEGGGGALEIPPTLHALLSARIDALAPPERAVAERGAVEGRLFHRGAVAALLAEEERAPIGERLATLARKELVRPDRAEIAGDEGFRFAHMLIRDAAYGAIPKRIRGQLHARHSDWLDERLGDAAQQEIVGYHLEQAARYAAELGEPDASLAERAARRLAGAGRAANARRDAGAAANLLGRAALLAPDDALLREELGVALYETGELTGAEEALREALALAVAAGDARTQALARIQLGFVRLRRDPEGAAEEAFREADAAIALGERDGDDALLARALFLRSEGHLMRAQTLLRDETLKRARRHAHAAGDIPLELDIVANTGPAIALGPIPVDEGLAHVQAVLDDMGHVPQVRSFALHLLGHLYARQGDFAGAHDAIDRWREGLLDLGQDLQYGSSATCAWDVCALAGDWERGERLLREGYEILDRMQERSFLSTVAAFLGEACYRQGRLEEAERMSAVSCELGSSDDRITQTLWRTLRAKVLAAREEHVEAEALARAAIVQSAGTDFLDARGDALLDLATVLRAAGREQDAAAAAAEALALYERKGNRVGIARARAAAAESAPASP